MAPSRLPSTLDEARGLFAVDGRPMREGERVEVTTAEREGERDALGGRERVHHPPILLPQHVGHATHARPILTRCQYLPVTFLTNQREVAVPHAKPFGIKIDLTAHQPRRALSFPRSYRPRGIGIQVTGRY